MVLLSFTLKLSAEVCNCGSFETGTYQYFTNEPGHCCDGTPNENPGGGLSPGLYVPYTYINGSWVPDANNVKKMTAAAAQRECCPSA